MALARDRDDGSGASTPQGGEDVGGVRDKLPEARQKSYDDVLAGLERGEDDPSVARKAKQGPPTGKEAGAARPSRAAPASRAWTDDQPEDGIVEGAEDDDEAETEEAEEAPKPRPRKPVAVPADADEDEDDSEDDDDDESEDEDADDEDGASADDQEDDDDGEEEDDSPATKAKEARALKKIAERDRRSVRQDAERRAAFEREKASHWREIEPHVATIRQVHAMNERAKSDPLGFLMDAAEKVAKLDGDQWEAVAKQFFLRSPKGAT